MYFYQGLRFLMSWDVLFFFSADEFFSTGFSFVKLNFARYNEEQGGGS